MLSNYPDELTCDMAETYGVFDIYRLPVRTLATLAVGLRDDSRVMMAKSGRLADDKTVMLSYIADLLRGVQPSDPNSLTARCYADGTFAKKPAAQPSNDKHEIFNGPEDFRKRWEEITR